MFSLIKCKTFHWSWMCGKQDDNVILTIRMLNALITWIIWSVWIFDPEKVSISETLKITIVQVTIMRGNIIDAIQCCLNTYKNNHLDYLILIKSFCF